MKEHSKVKPPKLTDAERHKRFVDMAHEVEASDKPEDFDRAFLKVTEPKGPEKPKDQRGPKGRQ